MEFIYSITASFGLQKQLLKLPGHGCHKYAWDWLWLVPGCKAVVTQSRDIQAWWCLSLSCAPWADIQFAPSDRSIIGGQTLFHTGMLLKPSNTTELLVMRKRCPAGRSISFGKGNATAGAPIQMMMLS
ncbi:hypothetical protein AVEN_100389-1 [Araneus ventricosus]|uniref:Uncharacterized protein n=1 Tax=Araneus ventricosus TaxID=182803 RepID=A0A4Y2Q0R3_ARAVE|nr:hypothetical protein AVEN_100389-1 [Araneus ventricosus]